MTRKERQSIIDALSWLDKSFDPDCFSYTDGDVMQAHRILKAINLTPRVRAKTEPKPKP